MIRQADDVSLTVIEGFCGAGGMSLGLAEAGLDVRLAFDINESAVRTYNANIGPHAMVLDASTVTGGDLLNLAGLRPGELDVFSGGPPCQGFSKQRRGAHEATDDRNVLVLHFARLVTEMSPKIFLFENVEVFGQKRGEELISRMADILAAYEMFGFFVCSSDFGLARTRSRFLMIGQRRDLNLPEPILPFSNFRPTIREVIGHLPSPPTDYTEHPRHPNHIKCKISAANEERFSHVPQGGGWQNIPFALRLPCHQVADTKAGGWPDVYGRLEWNSQCPTITAGFDSFTRGRYGHPQENRSLTLHEGALLQGFPESFRFFGTRGDIRLQIGNAVPPPLARSAGEAIKAALTCRTSVGSNGQRSDRLISKRQPELAL
ncbi:DNA cytosine methyltransferase [Brevundimonas sp. TWP2-3-2]|uniref:DNA cytosine methyltransferase n=1 Tax=unclassified Brevundimonas TaxID=2622653 RepID=UPI003CEB54DC